MFHLDILDLQSERCSERVPKNILPNGGFFMVMNPMGLNPERNRLKKKKSRFFFDCEEKNT